MDGTKANCRCHLASILNKLFNPKTWKQHRDPAVLVQMGCEVGKHILHLIGKVRQFVSDNELMLPAHIMEKILQHVPALEHNDRIDPILHKRLQKIRKDLQTHRSGKPFKQRKKKSQLNHMPAHEHHIHVQEECTPSGSMQDVVRSSTDCESLSLSMEHAFNAKDCVQGEGANDNVGDLEGECLDLLWSNIMSSSTCDYASILADIDDALGDNNNAYTGCIGDAVLKEPLPNICGQGVLWNSHRAGTFSITSHDATHNAIDGDDISSLMSNNIKEMFRTCGNDDVDASHMISSRCIEDALINNPLSSISSQIAIQSANQAEVLSVTCQDAIQNVADDDLLGTTFSIEETLLANEDFLIEDVCNMFLTFTD